MTSVSAQELTRTRFCAGELCPEDAMTGDSLCADCRRREVRIHVAAPSVPSLRCFDCNEWKPDAEFHANRRRPTRRGRHTSCKACRNIARRAYWLARHR